jgi:CRISPR-associated protein Csm2
MADKHNRPDHGRVSSRPGNPKVNVEPKKIKTLSDLAEEVKRDYFKNNTYQELLKLTTTQKLDVAFKDLEEFTEKVAANLTVSQLRNVYGQIIKVRDDLQGLKLIRPNLAYVAARQDKNENGKKVMAFIDDLIRNVSNDEEHKSFNKAMEALVAYHKFYGKTN